MSRVEILQTTFSKNAFLGVSARLSNPLDDALYSPVRVTQKSEPVRKKLPGVNKSGGSGQRKSPGLPPGLSFRGRRDPYRSAGLDAAAVGVRPLVLVAVAAGADERGGRPRALVVGLVAAAVPPG